MFQTVSDSVQLFGALMLDVRFVISERVPFHSTVAADAAHDALAVEDTWFHGEGDADWDDPRAGDLHERHDDEWSTRGRLAEYRKYQAHDLPVFSVDYCVSRKNAARVYRKARRAGLIPLVTRVSLSRLTVTPPPALPGRPGRR